jgi:hypothetical protein
MPRSANPLPTPINFGYARLVRCLWTGLLLGYISSSADIGLTQEGERTSCIQRCQIVPLAGHQVSLQIDGIEKVRWNYGSDYLRPFFFPFNGPSGSSLTRMGHPGAPNHDHHQSVWFAHNKVAGLDFWSNNHSNRLRQKQWYAYQDGEHEAIMAMAVGWYDGDGSEIMEQDIVAALIALPNREHALEIQLTLRPSGKAQAAAGRAVELEKSNFGFLAVRVAKSISAYFGQGQLSNSEGQVGEPNIFAQPARWMDYSGPVSAGKGAARRTIDEGLTFFDHPDNPRYPTPWHVRQDGWMGAAFTLEDGWTLSGDSALTLRYLLHAHSGTYNANRAQQMHQQFAARGGFQISPSSQPHHQYEVRRLVLTPDASARP